MSLRYKGARISATPPTTTGGESGVASGAWTLEQQFQAQGAGNWPEPVQPKYIEDVFSTWLYSGTGSAQTITNSIDLSTKGGLVWIKSRETYSHRIFDTARGVGKTISSNSTGAQFTDTTMLSGFNTTGFNLGVDSSGGVNDSGYTFASWTFRKQPKFFDVVTYTGNGVAGRTIAHNLGSVPGCIIVKATSNTAEGLVYHQALGNTKYLTLFSAANGANAADTWSGAWNNTSPTSTNFTVGSGSNVNADGWTFVAYLFAHDAGGFGLTGSDNVISCGSYTATGNDTINLGYEPQWLLEKRVTNAGDDWQIVDNMRGFSMTNGVILAPNTSASETSFGAFRQPTSTGYINSYWGSGTIIYIAIRRGPMKVPTDATKVFNAQAGLTTDSTKTTTGFVTDWFWERAAYNGTGSFQCSQRLTQTRLTFNSTAAEGGPYGAGYLMFDYNDGFLSNLSGTINPGLMYGFQRAPSFFDEVCYTGTYPTVNTQTHNLGVAPELMIVKRRDSTSQWSVYSLAWLNSLGLKNRYGVLNATDSLYATDTDIWNNTLATSSSFQVNANATNANGGTFVAYLFATCAGVSKCGLYTGTGSTQTIDCGFTGGARFVLVKRADSTGDWYVWDTARGMVSGTDPSLLLNSTAAEVNANSIYTATTGFQIVSTAAGINASGGTYIFLAIA
jgi:hypothetical protein